MKKNQTGRGENPRPVNNDLSQTNFKLEEDGYEFHPVRRDEGQPSRSVQRLKADASPGLATMATTAAVVPARIVARPNGLRKKAARPRLFLT